MFFSAWPLITDFPKSRKAPLVASQIPFTSSPRKLAEALACADSDQAFGACR